MSVLQIAFLYFATWGEYDDTFFVCSLLLHDKLKTDESKLDLIILEEEAPSISKEEKISQLMISLILYCMYKELGNFCWEFLH